MISSREDINDFTDIKFVSEIVLKFVGVSSKHLRVFLESLRQSSEILRKCSGTFVWPSEQFWKIFGNLGKVVGNLREIIRKCRHQYVYLLYGSVSLGLGTTKSTNLIGWNGYWPRSRFSYLDRHLNRKCFEVKKLQTKCKIIDCFHPTIFISVSGKKLMRKKSWWELKKSKEDEQNLEEWNSARRCSEAKCQLVQTSYIKRIELLLSLPYNKHLINRAKSVCMGESWPRSRVQTSLRSVCTYDLGQDSPIHTSCSVNKS